jgi:hypothetical protein
MQKVQAMYRTWIYLIAQNELHTISETNREAR